MRCQHRHDPFIEAGVLVADQGGGAIVDGVELLCDGHGVALPTAALHFALGHPAVASVVLGGQSPQEVERNVAALSSRVPTALWADLKAERLLDAEAPVPPSVAG